MTNYKETRRHPYYQIVSKRHVDAAGGVLTLHCPVCDKRHHKVLKNHWEFSTYPEVVGTMAGREVEIERMNLEGTIEYVEPDTSYACLAHVKDGIWFYDQVSTHTAAGSSNTGVPMQYDHLEPITQGAVV